MLSRGIQRLQKEMVEFCEAGEQDAERETVLAGRMHALVKEYDGAVQRLAEIDPAASAAMN